MGDTAQSRNPADGIIRPSLPATTICIIRKKLPKTYNIPNIEILFLMFSVFLRIFVLGEDQNNWENLSVSQCLSFPSHLFVHPLVLGHVGHDEM